MARAARDVVDADEREREVRAHNAPWSIVLSDDMLSITPAECQRAAGRERRTAYSRRARRAPPGMRIGQAAGSANVAGRKRKR